MLQDEKSSHKKSSHQKNDSWMLSEPLSKEEERIVDAPERRKILASILTLILERGYVLNMVMVCHLCHWLTLYSPDTEISSLREVSELLKKFLNSDVFYFDRPIFTRRFLRLSGTEPFNLVLELEDKKYRIDVRDILDSVKTGNFDRYDNLLKFASVTLDT